MRGGGVLREATTGTVSGRAGAQEERQIGFLPESLRETVLRERVMRSKAILDAFALSVEPLELNGQLDRFRSQILSTRKESISRFRRCQRKARRSLRGPDCASPTRLAAAPLLAREHEQERVP